MYMLCYAMVSGRSGGAGLGSGDVIRTEYDQERLLKALESAETLQQRIKKGAAQVITNYNNHTQYVYMLFRIISNSQ